MNSKQPWTLRQFLPGSEALTSAVIEICAGWGYFSFFDLQKCLARSEYLCYLAASDKEVYGICLLYGIPRDFEVMYIYVHPNSRKKAVASGLLSAIIAKHADSRFFLEVRQSNENAIALYHKLGFKILGIKRKYYQDLEDALSMGFDRSTQDPKDS